MGKCSETVLGDAWFDDIRIEAVEDSEVVNLLSNPSFLPSVANPNIPDYWGVWGDATLGIDPWTLDFFSIVDEISPVASAGVIKIRYPSTGNFVPKPGSNQLSMYLLTGSPLSLVPGTYTFSIYAKADRSNTIINIQHPSKFFATAQVGTEWQRITATSTDFALLPSIHIQDPNSTVWFSAPQLEAGSNATSFRKPPGQGITSNPSLSSNVSATLKSTIRNHTISKIYRERAANVVQPLTIYTEYDYVLNETNVRARLIWSGNGQTTIQWKLISANGTDLTTIQSINLSKPGIHTFNVPISGLSAGVITIQATAYSSGSVVGMASNNFRKLNNVARDVRVNRFTRSLRVNNEPFIPLFLPINPTDVTDWHLNRFKTAGFNCLVGTPGTLLQSEIINNSVPLSKINNINQQLDKLHAAGMGLFWPIQWSLNDWWNNKNFYDGNISGLANTYQWIVSTFKNHPAILGWYIMDEPSVSDWETNSGFSESNVKDLWLAVKTSDPGRPAYVNWNHSWQISPYGGFECTDILSHDDYSLSGETFDYGELLSNVRMVNNSQVGRKPTFEFISGSYDEVLMRPSAAALRVHAWLHLVHGTRGFGYWSKIPMDPQVWAEMRTFNENSADLHNLILGNPDAVLRTSSIPSSTIQYAMWTVDDFAYLIAVNTAYCDQTLNIDVASFCERTVSSAIKLYSSGSINSVDGILNDNIGPLNYCVYRFVLEPGT